MRPRYRYIAFEVVAGANKQDVYRAAAYACKMLGIDRAEIRIITEGTDPRVGLFRCIHSRADDIKKAMALDGSPLRVLGVSGTIRAARRKFFPDKKSARFTA